jgi:TetR/AcrR family transcriptional regulator, regulator of cefoperazone and chloramphenicol sensitivity
VGGEIETGCVFDTSYNRLIRCAAAGTDVTISAVQPHHPSQTQVGAQTRERLVGAAERLFARKGFATTSVRDITRAAGCNVAAVNYHFGGKHNLYGEVFRRRMVAMREQRIASIRAARGLEGSLEEVLASFATAFLEPFVSPGGGRLLLEMITREMLDPQLPPELFLAEVVLPVHEALAEAIVAVTPGLAATTARLCVLSIVGQLLQVANRLRGTAASPGWSAELPPVHEMVSQIVRFSAAGVRACARAAK